MSDPFILSHLALWAVVIFQGLILLGVVRAVHELRQSSFGFDSPGADGTARLKGREAPSFTASDLFGRAIDSDDFRGQLTAMLFVSPDCSSCTVTLDEMNALTTKAKGNVIVVCRAGREECRRLAERYDVRVPMIADEKLEVSELFDVSTVPIAVLINENNKIGSYGYPGRGQLDEMLIQRTTEAQEVE